MWVNYALSAKLFILVIFIFILLSTTGLTYLMSY